MKIFKQVLIFTPIYKSNLFIFSFLFSLVFFFNLPKTSSQVKITVEDTYLNSCFFPNVDVEIRVEDFSNILSMQYSFNWDPSVLLFLNTNNHNTTLSGLGSGNFGDSDANLGRLTFAWIDPFLNGVSLPDGSVIYKIRFSVISPLSLPTAVDISNIPLAIEISGINGIIDPIIDNGQVILDDQVSPTIENCPSDITVDPAPECLTSVDWTPPSLVDDCDPPGSLFSTYDPGDLFDIGVTTVTYSALDNSGNEAPTCNFTVTVLDPPPISMDCIDELTIKVPPGVDSTIVPGIAPIFSFNCDNEGYSYTLSGETVGSGIGNPDGIYFNFGTTIVTFTTDNSGLTCSTNVNVIQTDCVPCYDQLYSESFDNGIPSEWTISGLWEYSPNGKAEGGLYWNNREAIGSSSGGGAAVLNSDTAAVAGIPFPHIGTLTSPVLDFSAQSEVYLKFTQYYRNNSSSTNVEVLSNTGWVEVHNNDNVTTNVETAYNDVVRIDISNLAAGNPSVQVRFNFNGNRYFWLVDDVMFSPCYPYPETFPAYLADSLITCCIPYDVDENMAPFVPDEIVIEWTEPTPEDSIKQNIRDSFGVISYLECCNYLELWTIGGPVIPENSGPDSTGASIGIKGIVRGADAMTEIDEAECNFYQWNELYCCTEETTKPPPNLPQGTSDQIVIAVLDTGIDWENEKFSPYLFDHEVNNSCFTDDEFGWNFVDDNNLPFDDHCPGHGTHVAGIVAQNLKAHSDDDINCGYRILPVKICDKKGLSTLYRAGCGTYYAVDQGAHVLSDSWGYYNVDSEILRNALEKAKKDSVLVITAAGNDHIDMDDIHQQYPACHTNDNVITVASVDTANTSNLDFIFSDFSNYSPGFVDIGAPGEDILSCVQNNLPKEKSGTSMATPAVSAAAAIGYHCFGNEMTRIKNQILHLNQGWLFGDLTDSIDMGRVLNFNVFADCSCYTSIEELNFTEASIANIYPNPGSDFINVEVLKSNGGNWKLEIYNSFGQKVLSQNKSHITSGQTIEINIGHLAPGLYWINIKQGDIIWASKIVKQ